MELQIAENSRTLKILFYLVAFFFLYYIITWYFTATDILNLGGDCGCSNKKASPTRMPFGVSTPHNTFTELSPKEKACVAVGICQSTDVGIFNPEEKHAWKHAIIMHADKIFTKQKEKQKPSTQRRRK